MTSAGAAGWRLSGAALLCAALALPLPTAAQPVGRFRLAWVRDEGAGRCPDGPAIAREVTRRLGRDPFVAADAPSIEASAGSASLAPTERSSSRFAGSSLEIAPGAADDRRR